MFQNSTKIFPSIIIKKIWNENISLIFFFFYLSQVYGEIRNNIISIFSKKATVSELKRVGNRYNDSPFEKWHKDKISLKMHTYHIRYSQPFEIHEFHSYGAAGWIYFFLKYYSLHFFAASLILTNEEDNVSYESHLHVMLCISCELYHIISFLKFDSSDINRDLSAQ